MTSWHNLITEEMEDQKETWEDVISCTLDDIELDRSFDNGYGGPEGKPFTLWTKNRVYFPICYDGAEWVGSASRNPDGQATEHLGGY